jgi:pyruvate formate lyase activating enzyme
MKLLDLPVVRRARLQEPVGDGRVKCILCERRCIIPNGGRGFCRTRINIDGELYTLVYGDINAISENPIEKGGLILPR